MGAFTASEEAIRPGTWDEYVGQHELKRSLDVLIQAAKRDGRRLDHILLVATPGAGKTALAELIADRMDSDFEYIKCPININQFCDRMEMNEHVIVMLDEIHNASKEFKELLLTALEGGVLMAPSGFRIDVSTITFIAATTKAQLGQLGEPLIDRFDVKPTWDEYTDEEMALIIRGMATRLGFDLPEQLATDLARAAGGTPRLAKPLVKRARDLGPGATADDVLKLVGIDADGLGAAHWEYLELLESLGGRAGFTNLMKFLRMDKWTVDSLERLLLLRGYIRFEPNGRKITQQGARRLIARRKAAA